MSFGVIIGLLLVIAAILLMVKKVDARIALLLTGLLMAILGGDFMGGLMGFSDGMGSTSLMNAICTAAAFAVVTKITGCQEHLTTAVLRLLKVDGAKFLALPLTMIFAAIVNFSLNAASGTIASLGAVMIPILVTAGYHPAAAAAALHVVTFASTLNPGQTSNNQVAAITGLDVMQVIQNQLVPVLILEAIYVVVMTVQIKVMKEDKCALAYAGQSDFQENTSLRINPIYCFAMFVPIILMLVSKQVEVLSSLKVEHAMLIGTIFAVVITRTDPKEAMVRFWEGAANGFKNVFSVVVCAKVFVAGLTITGVIAAMIALFTNVPALAKITSTVGPALMVILTGTGTGMGTAFNEAVTANAASFGVDMLNMGSLVTVVTQMANPLSPIAGQMFLLSGIAGASVSDIIKREIPGFLINIVVVYILFFVLR